MKLSKNCKISNSISPAERSRCLSSFEECFLVSCVYVNFYDPFPTQLALQNFHSGEYIDNHDNSADIIRNLYHMWSSNFIERTTFRINPKKTFPLSLYLDGWNVLELVFLLCHAGYLLCRRQFGCYFLLNHSVSNIVQATNLIDPVDTNTDGEMHR